MTLRVTFDLFSGRPNPAVTLSAADGSALLARLQPAKKPDGAAVRPPRESQLGYRGLLVEQIGRATTKLPARCRIIDGALFAPDAAYTVQGADIEEFVLGLPSVAGDAAVSRQVVELVRAEVKRRKELSKAARSASSTPASALKCPCAPLYEPDWWNSTANNWQIQVYNNCYNYACNQRTDTFAQPGLAAGAMYTALTCAAVKPAALRDDLVMNLAASTSLRCPGEGILVALVIWPGADFHWYRMGRDGSWSHKPGGTPVTNLDNDGKRIFDPRTANRGPYSDFCSMMIARHGHIKIS